MRKVLSSSTPNLMRLIHLQMVSPTSRLGRAPMRRLPTSIRRESSFGILRTSIRAGLDACDRGLTAGVGLNKSWRGGRMAKRGLSKVLPPEKAYTTGRWAEIMFRALGNRVARRWRFVSFRGEGGGEYRGIVDVLAIRK